MKALMIKKYTLLFGLLLCTKEIMNHTSLEELSNNRQSAYQQVEVGALYYHYRNPQLQYKVIDIGIQEATEKICVIYKALYGAGVTWVRDLDSWLAEVEVEGKKIARFQKVVQ